MKQPNRNEWLTIADVAAEIGFDRRTVARAIAEGRIPGYCFGVGRAAEYRIPVVQWAAFKAGTWQPKPGPSHAPPPALVVRRRATSVSPAPRPNAGDHELRRYDAAGQFTVETCGSDLSRMARDAERLNEETGDRVVLFDRRFHGETLVLPALASTAASALGSS